MSVNWHEQWALFAENFYDGKAHIQVGEKTLLLHPGPGFGDLSHPTTRLMMKMMKEFVPQRSIIDIGTGSGILAIASHLLGAKSILGIDIDEEAIKHARKNAKLNECKIRFGKILPKNLAQENILLMNMIFSEQKQVDPQKLNSVSKLWIVSGILISQKEEYLQQAKNWGWKLLKTTQESEWCGFIFTV